MPGVFFMVIDIVFIETDTIILENHFWNERMSLYFIRHSESEANVLHEISNSTADESVGRTRWSAPLPGW